MFGEVTEPSEVKHTSPSQEPPPAGQPVLSVRQMMESIRELLNSQSILPGALDQDIERLQQLMVARFAREETSGLYDETISRTPWHTADVRRLRQQHRRLREQLRAIQEMVRPSDGNAATHRDLRYEFDNFCEQYLEHEAAEQALLDEAYPGPDWVGS